MTAGPRGEPETGAELVTYVDVPRLERNLARFHATARRHGVAVRAHAKAHRTVEIARRQQQAGAVGIAVNHVAQAHRYVRAGITDVVLAHPWRDAWRLPLFAGLARLCRLAVHVDDADTVAALDAAARRAGSVVGVRIQLGTGDDVTATSDRDLLRIAHAVDAATALRLDGVTGYQALTTTEDAPRRAAVGRAAGRYVVRTAELLRRRGFAVGTVAVGGTPTAGAALAVPGVTEICTGAYALQDAGMAAIGVCAPDDVAVSVTAGSVAADSLLDTYPYPWQTPGERVRRTGAGAGQGDVLPPHVCALVLRIGQVTACEHGRPNRTWRVWNDTDAPDACDDERAGREAPGGGRTVS